MTQPTATSGGISRAKQLLGLAWPIVAARATQAVIGFADAFMVAPLGEEPLAAVTTGALNVFAFVILPMGTAFILQSFAAQLRGRGDLAAVARYAWYGLALAGAAGIGAIIAVPAVPTVLGWLGYTPGVHASMSTYLAIRLLSVTAAVGIEALGNWYGGLGNTRPALVAGLVAMVVNVALNYVLIEPRFGLPGYGVAGAAWASVTASFAGFFVICAAFLQGWGHEHATAPSNLEWREFVRVLRFGLPNGANWFLEFAAFAVFVNIVIAHLGTTALAAFNVVMQINSVSFMPAFGISSAGAILAGEAIGRRAYDDVLPIVKTTGKLAATWMGSVGLVYLTIPSHLMGLFEPGGATNGALVGIGTTMLALSAAWQVFDAAGMTLSEALRAAGDTTWCMAARLLLAWLVFTPLAWAAVFVFGGGIGAVMASIIAYMALLAILMALRFASGRWKTIDLVGMEKARPQAAL